MVCDQMTKSVSTEEYVRLRRLLTTARKTAGLTQSQVADLLGRPQSFVSKYECGERRLDVIEFLEVARILKLEPESLLRTLGASKRIS